MTQEEKPVPDWFNDDFLTENGDMLLHAIESGSLAWVLAELDDTQVAVGTFIEQLDNGDYKTTPLFILTDEHSGIFDRLKPPSGVQVVKTDNTETKEKDGRSP